VRSAKDGQATLGNMIKAVEDAPGKFTFILGEPEAVSREEADAAVHLALTLVRWFSSGAFARVP
jgi:hypothetical protein